MKPINPSPFVFYSEMRRKDRSDNTKKMPNFATGIFSCHVAISWSSGETTSPTQHWVSNPEINALIIEMLSLGVW
jgi:hypothetical protein